MQTAYKDLDIQLLPNGIIQELSQKSNLLTHVNTLTESFSTNLVSDSNSIFHWFTNLF
jgi:hypothetical protein